MKVLLLLSLFFYSCGYKISIQKKELEIFRCVYVESKGELILPTKMVAYIGDGKTEEDSKRNSSALCTKEAGQCRFIGCITEIYYLSENKYKGE